MSENKILEKTKILTQEIKIRFNKRYSIFLNTEMFLRKFFVANVSHVLKEKHLGIKNKEDLLGLIL